MDRTDYKKRAKIGLAFLIVGVLINYISIRFKVDGEVFLPLQLMLFISAFLLPAPLAILFGALTPLVSTAILGQPVFFYNGIIMVFEYSVYALAISLLYRKLELPSIISLIFAMILGRIAAIAVVFILASFFNYQQDPVNIIIELMVKGLIGIIIQLVVVPVAHYGLIKFTTLDID